MTEEVRKVLQIFQAGKVSVDEAERLLDALRATPTDETGSRKTAKTHESMSIDGDAHFDRDLTVTKLTVGGNTQVAGNAAASGKIAVGKSLDVGADLSVSGKAAIGGEARVGGDIRLQGEKSQFIVGRNVTVKRDLHLGAGTLEVKGDLIVDGKVIPREERP